MPKSKFIIELQLYQVTEFIQVLREFGFDGAADDIFSQYEHELLNGKDWEKKHERFVKIKMNYKSVV